MSESRIYHCAKKELFKEIKIRLPGSPHENSPEKKKRRHLTTRIFLNEMVSFSWEYSAPSLSIYYTNEIFFSKIKKRFQDFCRCLSPRLLMSI